MGILHRNPAGTPVQIARIAESVALACEKLERAPSVEEIQDLVEYQIMR